MAANRPRTRAAEREGGSVTEDQGGAPGGAGGGGWQPGGPAPQGSPPDPGDTASQAATGARSAIDGVGRQIPGNAAAQPAPMGLVYGDVLSRVVAIIIDGILLAIINFIVFMFLGVFLVAGGDALGLGTNWLFVLVATAIGLLISGAYFVGLWTTRRATLGMMVFSLQIGNESNGATLTMQQGIIRWLLLGAIFSIAQAFTPVAGLSALISLASFVWVIALLYTTWASPTKQGLHDKYAHTMVVKTVRTVA
jgi:uncharacterized RDD family membrane protein YckC